MTLRIGGVVFRIDAGSGVPIYRQLVEQVRRAVMLGRLAAGDQLPTLREVVDALAINPNTVVKAYAELEHEGLVVRRQGMGTFVTATPPIGALAAPRAVRESLLRWMRRAREAGMSDDQIRLLVSVALDEDVPGATTAGGVA
ncbi:MAG: GntR family transcriptional regulator [Jatrophihabitantaceae bacterium]